MEFQVMNEEESRAVRAFFEERVGIPHSFWSGHVFVYSNGGVYACTKACAEALRENWNVFSLGVQLFSDWEKRLPSHTTALFFALHVSKNKAEVGEAQLENVWRGDLIPLSKARNATTLSQGWVVIACNGMVVGSGFLEGKILKPLVPFSAHKTVP